MGSEAHCDALWHRPSFLFFVEAQRCMCFADVGKKEFQKLVMEAVDDITVDEVDLLYRVFDTNRDGFVELTELVKDGDILAIVTDDHNHNWDQNYNSRYD